MEIYGLKKTVPGTGIGIVKCTLKMNPNHPFYIIYVICSGHTHSQAITRLLPANIAWPQAISASFFSSNIFTCVFCFCIIYIILHSIIYIYYLAAMYIYIYRERASEHTRYIVTRL